MSYKTLIKEADIDQGMGREPKIAAEISKKALIEGERVDYPLSPLNVMFDDAVKEHPEAIAFEDGSPCAYTYKELACKSNKVAKAIKAMTGAEKCFVGIHLPRGYDLVVCIMGVLKSGNAYVPLAKNLPEDRLNYIIKDSGIKLFISDSCGSHEETGYLKIDVESLFEKAEYESDTHASVRQSINDLAYMIYTSGTTGRPKGVPIRHGGISNRLFWMRDYYSYGVGSGNLLKTQIGFDVSVLEIFFPLTCGAKMVLLEEEIEKEIGSIVEKVIKHDVTWMPIAPTQLNLLLDHNRLDECRTLTSISCGIEAWSFSMVGKFYKQCKRKRLFNGYGPTEASVGVAVWETDPDYKHACLPFGRPIHNVSFLIANEDFHPVNVGQAGELLISGICLSPGYWNNEEQTKEKYIFLSVDGERTRFYRSGDLVRQLPDGNIIFVGRRDNQIKIRGIRVELEEIEAVVNNIPGLKAAVVLDIFKEEYKKLAVAYIAEEAADGLSNKYLMEYCKSRLPEALVPAIWKKVNSFPTTINGKIDRDSIKHGFEKSDAYARKADYGSEIANTIGSIWGRLLNLESFESETSFFDYGGNSLLAFSLLNELNSAFNIEIGFQQLLKNSNMRLLEAFIGERLANGNSPITAGKTERSVGPKGFNLPYFYIIRTDLNPQELEKATVSALRKNFFRPTDIYGVTISCNWGIVKSIQEISGRLVVPQINNSISIELFAGVGCIYVVFDFPAEVAIPYNQLYDCILEELKDQKICGEYIRDHAFRYREKLRQGVSRVSHGIDKEEGDAINSESSSGILTSELIGIENKIRNPKLNSWVGISNNFESVSLSCPEIVRFHPNCAFGIIEAIAKERWSHSNHAKIIANHRFIYRRDDSISFLENSTSLNVVLDNGMAENRELFARLAFFYGLELRRHKISGNPFELINGMMKEKEVFMMSFDFNFLKDRREYGQGLNFHPVLVCGINNRHRYIAALEQTQGRIKIPFIEFDDFYETYSKAGIPVEYFAVDKKDGGVRLIDEPYASKCLSDILSNLLSENEHVGINGLERLCRDVRDFFNYGERRVFYIQNIWSFSHELYYLNLFLSEVEKDFISQSINIRISDKLKETVNELHYSWFEIDTLFERALHTNDPEYNARALEKMTSLVEKEKLMSNLLLDLYIKVNPGKGKSGLNKFAPTS